MYESQNYFFEHIDDSTKKQISVLTNKKLIFDDWFWIKSLYFDYIL